MLIRKPGAAWIACCVLLLSMLLLPAALAVSEALPEEPLLDTVRYATVATEKGTLNMRAEPKDNAKVLKKLARESIVTIDEELDGWTKIRYGSTDGYVMSKYLQEVTELPYPTLTKDDKSDAVLAFKRSLHKLGYIKSEEINTRFDAVLESALTKLQLMNGVSLNPTTVTPELQALIEWGMIAKAKSGYVDTATDQNSGLSISIFCWDSDGMLYEKDKAVKLQVSFAAQASGGQAPYTITVRKSLDGSGGEVSGDVVASPFSFIWGQNTERLYVYATVVDAAGNTVTACAPFRYTLPARYVDEGGLG